MPSARHLPNGAEFNCAANRITVMVNPPDYVSTVTNNGAIIGGSDEESDEAIRSRILQSYAGKFNYLTEDAYKQLALKVDGVLMTRRLLTTKAKMHANLHKSGRR